MKDCILLQHGSNGHEKLLGLTLPVHRKYAEAHKLDYYATGGDHDLEGRHPMWTKVVLLKWAFAKGYEKVIWLDADCLIVDIETDLRDAIPIKQIGVTWHEYDWAKIGIADVSYNHWNTGAVYCGAGDFTMNLLNEWWKTDDDDHPWHDQHAFNKALLNPLVQCVKIDPKWNSIIPLFESPTPVVRHWAGFGYLPQRAGFIKEAVEGLSWV